eukprot:CAMPEP_0198113444 /NCGR_PEP_ID=MMETSP1442-20131203/5115_1 /TAXON_ID= /ORGANISM="Craspedostauros australis, Strain CCMP3328" /LENGTH=229 /DNA_ID=CAMNT_0043770531 /DNA_START=643 /DNA_END=1332 /DNA_ORIENTATION=-
MMSTTTETKHLTTKSPDALDSFFGMVEGLVCPSPTALQSNAREEPTEPDVVDYVFEHVESYICADERTVEDESEQVTPYNIGRDNSLVTDESLRDTQPDPQGELLGRPAPVKKSIKPIGQRGDVIDYVFENVESLVCRDDTTLGSEEEDIIRQMGNDQGKRQQAVPTDPYGRRATPPTEIDVDWQMDVPVRDFDRYSPTFGDGNATTSAAHDYKEQDEIRLFFRPGGIN